MLDYNKLLFLDAEYLAEGGIGRRYNSLLAELRRYIAEPAAVEEDLDNEAPRYLVRCPAPNT